MQDRQFEDMPESSKQKMRDWFYANFEDPVHSCPRIDGEYLFVHGGPYDALEVLSEEFEGTYEWCEIEDLADELFGSSSEWSPVPDHGMSQHEINVLFSVDNHSAVFKTSLNGIESLASLDIPEDLKNKQYGMLLVNVISTLETYLSDRFYKLVIDNEELIRRFVENSDILKKESTSISKIFHTLDGLKAKVGSIISKVTWHNISSIVALYKGTLQVNLGNMDTLAKYINMRHDLVHRNGKAKDDTFHSISKEDVMSCVTVAQELVDSIEEQLDSQGYFGGPESES